MLSSALARRPAPGSTNAAGLGFGVSWVGMASARLLWNVGVFLEIIPNRAVHLFISSRFFLFFGGWRHKGLRRHLGNKVFNIVNF